jgi:hypothetical protein
MKCQAFVSMRGRAVVSCSARVTALMLGIALLTASAASSAAPKRLRVYMIGNSMTDQVSYKGLAELARSRGHDHVWGRHIILGAPISWIWQHPDKGLNEKPFGRYETALMDHEWDAITLNPTDRHLHSEKGEDDVTMSLKFLELARRKSPDVQLYIYQRTPRREENEKADKSSVTDEAEKRKDHEEDEDNEENKQSAKSPKKKTYKPIDYPAQWLRKYDDDKVATTYTRDYYEKLVAKLRKEQPEGSKPVRLIPLGEVVFELDARIKRGEVPGMSDVNEVYSDASHFSPVGRYLTGLTFYAALYGESPVGLPVPESYGDIAPATAAALQQIVADVTAANKLG